MFPGGGFGLCLFVEIGSYTATQAGLEFSMLPRLSLNQFSLIHLLNARITGVTTLYSFSMSYWNFFFPNENSTSRILRKTVINP